MTANTSILNFREELIKKAKSLNLCAVSLAKTAVVHQAPPVPLQNIPKGLDYLNKNAEIRLNPDLIHAGTICILSAAMAYKLFSPRDSKNFPQTSGQISAYACGRDYHKVLKKKLTALGNFLRDYLRTHCNDLNLKFSNNDEELTFRAITDSAPFPEQYVASTAGLASIGKNGLCSVLEIGSSIFLGELLLNTDLVELFLKEEPNTTLNEGLTICLYPNKQTSSTQSQSATQAKQPHNVHCIPSCHACISSCPTGALSANEFDAAKCLSYLTIEADEEIPFSLWKALGTRVYGCDSCQNTCPRCHTNDVQIDSDFTSRFAPKDLDFLKLITLSQEDFTKLFAGTPVMHAGYRRFMRNVFTAASNSIPTIELHTAILSRLADFPEYSITIKRAAHIIEQLLKR